MICNWSCFIYNYYMLYVWCIAMYFMYPIIIHVCRMVITCYSHLLVITGYFYGIIHSINGVFLVLITGISGLNCTCYSQLLMPGMHPPHRRIFRGHATICAFRGVRRGGVLARCHGHQPPQKGGHCCVNHVLYMYGIYIYVDLKDLYYSISKYICTYVYNRGRPKR